MPHPANSHAFSVPLPLLGCATLLLLSTIAHAAAAVNRQAPTAVPPVSDDNSTADDPDVELPLYAPDICDKTEYSTYATSCPSSQLLSDHRYFGTLDAQCRVLCPDNVPPGVTASVTHTDCAPAVCKQLESRSVAAGLFVLHSADPDGIAVSDTCVSRAMCAQMCGDPPSGCVYSGTCGSLICFANAAGNPVPFERLTHQGPASQLSRNSQEKPPVAFVSGTLLQGVDACDGLVLPLVAPCVIRDEGEGDEEVGGGGKSSALATRTMQQRSGLGGHVQCRALCEDWAQAGQFEIIRISTRCPLCASKDAATYLTPLAPDADYSDDFDVDEDPELSEEEERLSMCVPMQVCAAQCGQAAPPGCVYSGSCGSLLCFSDISSKLPASITVDDDAGMDVTVGVPPKGAPSDADPPAFATLLSGPGFPIQRDPTLPPALSTTSSPLPEENETSGSIEPTPERLDQIPSIDDICIAAKHLTNLPATSLLFATHRRTAVLCDSYGSCATRAHIVRHRGVVLTMAQYCERTMCDRRIMHVNSPVYAKGWRLRSSSPNLHFTAFAARFETRIEVSAIRLMIAAGL